MCLIAKLAEICYHYNSENTTLKNEKTALETKKSELEKEIETLKQSQQEAS